MAIVAKINTGGTIGRATISAPRNTTIVSQNFKPKPNIALGEIVDVSVEGLEDGYTLLYNSSLNKYEVSPLSNVAIDKIQGGQF